MERNEILKWWNKEKERWGVRERHILFCHTPSLKAFFMPHDFFLWLHKQDMPCLWSYFCACFASRTCQTSVGGKAKATRHPSVRYARWSKNHSAGVKVVLGHHRFASTQNASHWSTEYWMLTGQTKGAQKEWHALMRFLCAKRDNLTIKTRQGFYPWTESCWLCSQRIRHSPFLSSGTASVDFSISASISSNARPKNGNIRTVGQCQLLFLGQKVKINTNTKRSSLSSPLSSL